MSTIFELLKALPELIKLVQAIQEAIKEAETDRKVSEDIKTIHEAFTTKDAEKLNALFSSK